MGSIKEVLQADAEARRYAEERVGKAGERPRATSFI
jgi:hypothetical protein